MKFFKNLFKAKEIEPESKDNSIQKSICSLMIEVAYADDQLDESELKAIFPFRSGNRKFSKKFK